MSNKLESTSGYSHESPIINNKKADWTSTPDKWNNSMMEQDWKFKGTVNWAKSSFKLIQ